SSPTSSRVSGGAPALQEARRGAGRPRRAREVTRMNDDSRGRADLALFGAFLAGAVIGAGIALLFAPRSGAETREQVAAWAQRAEERGGEAAWKRGDAARREG